MKPGIRAWKYALQKKLTWRYRIVDNTAVDTVMNHRIVQRVNIIAAVSGGVHVDARTVVNRDKIQADNRGQLNSERERSIPTGVAKRSWWWD